MINKLIIILLLTISMSLSGQEINSIEKIISEQNLKFIIKREKPGEIQILEIYNLNNENLINKIKLDNEYDLRNFGAHYFGKRKFIVLDGRYSFFIVNLSTNKLIGPFGASNRGCAHDAQSYVVGYFSIFNNGQYLTFASLDYGVYCYSLIDLYNPKEIEMFYHRTKGFNEVYFFLDKRNDSLFNGITTLYEIEKGNIYSRKITPEFLFQGYKFKTSSDGQIIKKQLKEKYLLLYKIRSDNSEEPIIIDFDKGILIDRNNNRKLFNELISEI